MGDSRLCVEKAERNLKSKKLLKDDNNNADKTKKKKSDKIPKPINTLIQNNFIIHGLDYLPDFEKRKQKRKKNVPKFFRIDHWHWASTYRTIFSQTILNRPNKSLINNNCDIKIKCEDLSEFGVVQNGKTEDVLDLPVRQNTIHPSSTIASLLTFVSDDWKLYTSYPFRNLVMSGGGSKGYAFIGALKALEDCGILENITHIAGSSAGAICAGLLCVGCSPQDIANVFKCDIKWLFHDQPCACFCCLPHVCKKYGVHPAKRFYEIYGNHLAKKSGNMDITFKEVSEKFGRELTIVVTNLSRMCSEYCNSKTCPNLPIRKAVRMSMAFPVVFRAMRENITGTECVYTDGGLLDQYPIRCFDDMEIEVNHNKENFTGITDECNMRTIGLYVVSERPIDYKIWQTLFGMEIPYKPTYLPNTKLARERLKHEMHQRKRDIKDFSKKEFMDELRASVGDKAVDVWDHYEIHNKSHVDISNFGEYFVATIETLLISQRKIHVKPSDFQRTVAINCGYIGTNDYIIEAGDREFMINQGYVCTSKYLSGLIKNFGNEITTPMSTDDVIQFGQISNGQLSTASIVTSDHFECPSAPVDDNCNAADSNCIVHGHDNAYVPPRPSVIFSDDGLSYKSARTSPFAETELYNSQKIVYPSSDNYYSMDFTTASHSLNSLYNPANSETSGSAKIYNGTTAPAISAAAVAGSDIVLRHSRLMTQNFSETQM